ncbi:hypothetical protein FB468_2823 [Leucobacter komagatae]|uniref:Uncharacterized protein n=1 Tax=Leucobacter komagatae TaxID=55969 RepID=A0A542Y9K6_9MICO|nr:hypothetical protein FB468_2823 [Leucobacter komagatae]
MTATMQPQGLKKRRHLDDCNPITKLTFYWGELASRPDTSNRPVLGLPPVLRSSIISDAWAGRR